MAIKNANSLSFFVNGKRCTLSNFDPTVSLNYWLRHEAGLTGTKCMCNEGGCGSCVVSLQYPMQKTKIANSCLTLLGAIDGCHVTTIEGIGSSQVGFHEIQSNLAKHGGIQCGYCTPGFVMSMHGFLQENPSPTQLEIENNFDGNLCRCTGYRSILDAMKCFACKPNEYHSSTDIEDLVCDNSGVGDASHPAGKLHSTRITCSESTWVRLVSFLELMNFFKETKTNFKLLCGNTGSGIYKTSTIFPLYVDISHVQEFRAIKSTSDSVEFGASVCLNEVADYLALNATESVTFEPIASHILRIAGNPVRNVASWAGNVMLKHQHNDFPSDICTIFEAGGAKIKVYDMISQSHSTHSIYGSDGILNTDMEKKIIVSVSLPKVRDNGNTRMKCFKIMPRAQNAYAYVNAAFLASLSETGGQFADVRLVYGGVSASFHLASRTGNYLKGKSINSNATLKGALHELSEEANVSCEDQYKLNLLLGLFYKFYLSLCDVNQLGPSISSGFHCLSRPVSSGNQTFKPDPSTYPVSKDMPKISALLQASGEAKFISDSAPGRGDLFCDVVLSSVGNADVDVIDVSEAERISGFVQIISKDNFPNEVTNAWYGPNEPSLTIIASDHVDYAGQVVAIAVAESLAAARRVAAAVKVTYKNVKKPLLTVKDAVKANSLHDVANPEFVVGDPDESISSAKHVITGELEFHHQYHFYMETQVCKVERTEDNGFLIDSATQSQTDMLSTLSYAFGVPANKIEITTKRIGGAYGGKVSNSQYTTCIAALAAHVTKRPIHFHTSLETCMKMLGSRTPFTLQYKVGFNDDGIVSGVDATVYQDGGCSGKDPEDGEVLYHADSAYYCPNRRYKTIIAKTNLPSTTWCRAPTSLQMTATADLIVEHVASYLKKDPVDVKYANMYEIGQMDPQYNEILHTNFRSVYQDLLTKYAVRERMKNVQTFNANNKWKKRGLAVTPMKYSLSKSWMRQGVLISVYKHDGSVVVSHGGIDSGQGINVKVAQTVSYKLGIPMDMIKVQRSSTITSANSTVTAGSVTSEAVCQSAIDCCDILNSRMAPVRAKMESDVSWLNLVERCHAQHVELTAAKMSKYSDEDYQSFGVTAAEVEYDVITGERQILEVDILFDCGVSLNPNVDIGQIEGAFLMGVGFWLSEKMVYDQTTGRLLSDGTWEYKPPSSQDIPIKWNIDLLQDTPNPVGVLRSKATGEPPICMSVCVAIALKQAVEASRKDRGMDQYFTLPTPATVDALHNALALDPLKDFSLQ